MGLFHQIAGKIASKLRQYGFYAQDGCFLNQRLTGLQLTSDAVAEISADVLKIMALR
jgi:hypothetical protein